MNEQKINQLFVYKRKIHDETGKVEFEFLNRTILKDIPIFKQVSMQFYFVNRTTKERDSILFAKIDQIFKLNFYTGVTEMVYKFQQTFQMQLVFFRSNVEQDVMIVASQEDCIYINTKNTVEVDVD